MTIPANGITPEVIRDLMPPYRLSADLLAATFAILPAPPPNATIAWRHARITRLLEEIAALKPADAAQARIATAILITRELADSIAARAQAPDQPLAELCRIARTSAELQRSANALERTLARHQQKPVPFFGTVVQDEVDIQALDALWGRGIPASAGTGSQASAGTGSQAAAGAGATPPPAAAAPPPRSAVPAGPPDAVPPAADAAPPPPADPPPRAPAQPDRAPAAVLSPDRAAATAQDWTLTRLDEGPGWTCDVLRPRTQVAEAPRQAAK